MKICVVQPDLSRIGGSIATIMSFADCFKQLGHDVEIVSSFGDRFPENPINSKQNVLSHYGCKYLEYSDIKWSFVQRSKVETDADLCFARGFDSTRVSEHKTILWIIVPQEVSKSNVQEYWTNSNTIRNTLNVENSHVVIPPHDYSIFRNNIQEEKEYDVVSILRGNDFKLKGLQTYADTVKNLNCKSMLITTSTSKKDLERIKGLNVPFVLNQTKNQVAEILGKSKTFFFPSYMESCPLVIYEALNSGCTIVSRNVGAVKEQLNNHGYIFNHDREIMGVMNMAMKFPMDVSSCVERGMVFDRVNQLGIIDERLKTVEV